MDRFAKVCPRCGAHYDAVASFCQKDGSALRRVEENSDPYIGRVLLEQFRIEERIGVGGMGTVYRARQTTLDRDVAIKILHPDLASNPDAVRRFQREARISTSLDHPNIVRVFLFGQLPDGSLYLVMELLRGRTLSQLLRESGGLSLDRALHIAVQVADGVGEAHGQGIVHRDVKPENVFLISKGRDPDFVKVLDFGIARIFQGDDQSSNTQTGLVFGTARYISPEGAAGERSDARSDVYSLGVLTYQLLCGETPFDAPSPVTLLMAHVHESPPDIRRKPGGRNVPRPVADVVMRSLGKHPDGRYDDAGEFGRALREAAEESGISPRVFRSSTGNVSGFAVDARRDPSGVIAAENRTEELRVSGLGRSRGIWIGVAAFAIGAVGVGATAYGIGLFEPHVEVQADADAPILEAAEEALAARRYDELSSSDEPSVAALTARILAHDATHARALELRRQAAARLVADALQAAEGDALDRARSLYQRAAALDPENASIGEAIARLDARQDAVVRPASIVVSPAPLAGEPVLLTATLASNAEVTIHDRPRFVVVRGTRRIAGPLEAAPGPESGTWVSSFAFPAAGSHRIKFVAGSDEERHYELVTEVTVTRSRRERPRIQEEAPSVITQGSAGPVSDNVPAVVDAPILRPTAPPPSAPVITPLPPSEPPPIFPLSPASVPTPAPEPTPAPSEQPAPPPPWSSGSQP